ncbi:MAG: class C beta-lactamase-related serine hydrolase [Alphaproteobacteria bacterium]|nr:class C beta-lactamase-related serine hydrolase [Alphaproteobacteria bacterium]
MLRAAALTFCLALAPSVVLAAQAGAPARPAMQLYYPERFDWQKKAPADVGFNAARLDAAVKFAISKDTKPNAGSMLNYLATTFGASEPFDTPIGPVKDRAPANGFITRHGYVVAEWGDTNAVDMVFSVSKTFLTTVVGLAVQRGLIKDVNDFARPYMPTGVDLFDAAHNRNIRWDHMLRQSSDWQGTLWGKPDWADRPEGATPAEWPNRKLYEPGTRYKYSDVRVNMMALAALYVWRRPLPDVLREEIMNPIGASSTWRWYGYDNSWVDIDGTRMQSVAAGGHWGGGMQLNAWDMGRFGYLFLRNGKWKDRQLVSEKWIEMARTPGPANKVYGFANWYLNTGKEVLPAVSDKVFWFQGNGNNIVYMDQENDIVAVVRWIDTIPSLNEFARMMNAALEDPKK